MIPISKPSYAKLTVVLKTPFRLRTSWSKPQIFDTGEGIVYMCIKVQSFELFKQFSESYSSSASSTLACIVLRCTAPTGDVSVASVPVALTFASVPTVVGVPFVPSFGFTPAFAIFSAFAATFFSCSNFFCFRAVFLS
jgi:hypothetical protein